MEGACGLVLPGARDLLNRSAVVMVEVEDQNWWGKRHWLREQVVSYLYDLGLVPVARDFQHANQYNIVFLRADLLVGATRMRSALARFVSRADDQPPLVRMAGSPPAGPPAATRPRLASRVRKIVGRLARSARHRLRRWWPYAPPRSRGRPGRRGPARRRSDPGTLPPPRSIPVNGVSALEAQAPET